MGHMHPPFSHTIHVKVKVKYSETLMHLHFYLRVIGLGLTVSARKVSKSNDLKCKTLA